MLLNNDVTRLTSNGELEINLEPVHPLCLYFKPWEKGLDVYLFDIDGQTNDYRIDPGIPILTQAANKNAGLALKQFVQGIPECYRAGANKFIFNQTVLLQWLARYPAARDLLVSNSVLLWLLVDVSLRRMWQPAYIIKMLSLKQSKIIGEIIDVPSNAVAKYLRKLIIKRGDRRELGLIIWSLKKEHFLNCTRHLNKIPVYVVSVIFRTPELATKNLVQSIADALPEDIDAVSVMSEASRIRQIWKDTLNIGFTLGVCDPQRILTNCRSLQHMHHLHERWTRRLNRRNLESIDDIKFPVPPLEGTPSIIPVTSSLELHKEGKEMQHCVGSYSDKILDGEAYIYTILKPQRATVEILINGDQLSIGGFSAYSNEEPTERCRKKVMKWLDPRYQLNKQKLINRTQRFEDE